MSVHGNVDSQELFPSSDSENGIHGSSERMSETKIESYGSDIPREIAGHLRRLYESEGSTIEWFRLSGEISSETRVYVSKTRQGIEEVLFFNIEGNKARILNQRFRLSDEALAEFAACIFKESVQVDALAFQEIATSISTLRFPFALCRRPGDVILDLPDSPEKFRSGLGRSTRNNVRRYPQLAQRAHPDFRVEFYACDAIDEQMVRTIVGFNEVRMNERKQAYSRSEQDLQKILGLAKAFGLVSIVRMNNEICAGAIGYSVGKTYVFKIISHDPRYNAFRLGTVCTYFTICESIRRGHSRFNFMSGHNEYKRNFGGKLTEAYDLVIFRSRLKALLNSHFYLRSTARNIAFHISFTLQERLYHLEESRRLSPLGLADECAYRMLSGMRRGVHLLQGLRSVRR